MNISFDAAELKPFIEATVSETIRQREADEAKLGDRLGFTEPEAASLLGIAQHVLRDARRRGEISAKMCGKRFLYSRSELLRFLND